MTPPPKPLALFYFFSGLLVGLMVGVPVEEAWPGLVRRVVAPGMLLLVALFWRRIESTLRGRYMEAWAGYRARGKWRFVLVHYIVVRGLVLIVVVAAPMLDRLAFSAGTAGVLAACVALLAALMAYVGQDAWASCEQEYEVRVLRQAAERTRAAAN